MRKRILPALLAISLLATSVFGLTACNNTDNTTNEPPKEETPAPEQPEPEKPAPEITTLPVLGEAKASEIRTAYYEVEKKHFTSEYYTYTADDVSFRYYGEYNGSYVTFIDTPFFDYTLAIETQTIDGVPFIYGSGQSLTVYNNGKFCSMSRAFENGLLTHDDLLIISYKLGYGLYTKA